VRFKLDHIGLVVESIESFIKLLQILGFNERTEPVPDPIQKVSASFVNVGDGGDVYIELLEPTHPSSPITNFLKKRGEGLHHLCFEVDDIEKASKELVQKDFPMVSSPVDCEAYDKNLKRDCKGSTRIAFFLISKHILIELIEKDR
jgi:methylmalonyl-CoA epimerase